VTSSEKKGKDEKFDFENLLVYQKSLEYVDFIHKLTAGFPNRETFILSDQIKRAAVSICLNIAEGSGGSKAEFQRFLTISRRSVRECIAATEIAYRQGFINLDERLVSREFCREISKMLNGLLKSIRTKGNA
jgi:four helix bundle protein